MLSLSTFRLGFQVLSTTHAFVQHSCIFHSKALGFPPLYLDGNASQSFLVMITSRDLQLSPGKRGQLRDLQMLQQAGREGGQGIVAGTRQEALLSPTEGKPAHCPWLPGPPRAARGAEGTDLQLSPTQNLSALSFWKMQLLPLLWVSEFNDLIN